MGRYYNGDIEGKFWFGVQSSDDADFFGVQGEPRYYSYYFEKENLPKIEEGIKKCKNALGSLLKPLNKFFEENNGYNDKMLVDYLNERRKDIFPYLDKSDNFNEKEIRSYLEWYARLELGEQILDCVKEKGYCNFEAEL
tara:strand:- start:158 stop:574 length:417 start_codon:yes stop_codon:yes gene_type:complete